MVLTVDKVMKVSKIDEYKIFRGFYVDTKILLRINTLLLYGNIYNWYNKKLIKMHTKNTYLN